MTIKNHTVIDRLADRLKTADGDDFFTEEDRLELAREAIKKAFFEPRQVTENPGAYNSRTKTHEPLLVEMTREAFRPYVQSKVELAVAHLVEAPEFRSALAEAMATALPGVIARVCRGQMEAAIIDAPQAAVDLLAARIRNL